MKLVTTTKQVVFTKDFQNPYSVPAGTELYLSDKVADKLVKLQLATVVVAPTVESVDVDE